MLGGLFSWWVFIHLSFTREWLVIGMPSPMIKRSKTKSQIIKQNSPRIVDSWTVPVVSDKPWSVIVGGGGVKSLPFCLGTAYNVSSMEDIGNSWSLCWQWKHTSQNYFHLCFKSFELWHLCKSLLPSAKGLSFTFMQESVVFLLIPTYSLVGKHHVVEKDLSIYGHSNIFDHELLLLTLPLR